MEKWDYDYKELLQSSGRQDFNVMGYEGITDVSWGRNCFFLSLKEIVPEALEELSGTLFHQFIELMNVLIEKQSIKTVWDLEQLKQAKDVSAKQYELFERALYTWGNKYNINRKDQWFFNEIPQVLSMWYKNEKYLREKRFIYGGNFTRQFFNDISEDANKSAWEGTRLHNVPEELVKKLNYITYEEWIRPPKPDPRQYDVNEYLKMCEERYYFQKQLFELMGYIEMPKKKNLGHFNWLVYYQVKGMGYMEIANCCSEKNLTLSEDTIRRGVNNVSNLIGLTLRPKYKGGRPKKHRN